jgi:hypothetical protein
MIENYTDRILGNPPFGAGFGYKNITKESWQPSRFEFFLAHILPQYIGYEANSINDGFEYAVQDTQQILRFLDDLERDSELDSKLLD